MICCCVECDINFFSLTFLCSTIPYSKFLINKVASDVMDNNDLNFKEMEILVYGYIHQFEIYIDDITGIILMQCGVLPTFDGLRTRKIDLNANYFSCDNRVRRIECFQKDGYKYGIHYLSINFNKSQRNNKCCLQFGITPFALNKNITLSLLSKLNDYKISVNTGIYTIKLDCRQLEATFYKHYKICHHVHIEKNIPYCFYVKYCNEQKASIQMVYTDLDKIVS